MRRSKKNKVPSFFPARIFVTLIIMILAACSFNYGDGDDSSAERPDIVMKNIEYVRVRKGDVLARFKAEHAERYEERQTMALRNFTFEQMEDRGERINVEGTAREAEVQLESGDIALSGGVVISIASEDIIINIPGIEWKDNDKTLWGNSYDNVDVTRSDGTNFTGKGFHADIRNRTWSFSSGVEGSYVEEDE